MKFHQHTVRNHVQDLLNTAPSSWRAAFRAAGLTDHPSIEEALELLEQTAGGNDAGPRGREGYVPSPAVRAEALHGLILSHRFNYAGWEGLGVARAVQLATQPSIPEREVRRMYVFFQRNRRYMTYSTFGDDKAGASSWLAWLNWGGMSGWEWASQVLGYEIPED
jgi:hypothetical protein